MIVEVPAAIHRGVGASLVIPGRCQRVRAKRGPMTGSASNPESRDSGFIAPRCPGMTATNHRARIGNQAASASRPLSRSCGGGSGWGLLATGNVEELLPGQPCRCRQNFAPAATNISVHLVAAPPQPSPASGRGGGLRLALVPRMLRSAPLLAAWCAADPGPMIAYWKCGSRLCGAAQERAAPRPGHGPYFSMNRPEAIRGRWATGQL
jgi:hypothetical protein